MSRLFRAVSFIAFLFCVPAFASPAPVQQPAGEPAAVAPVAPAQPPAAAAAVAPAPVPQGQPPVAGAADAPATGTPAQGDAAQTANGEEAPDTNQLPSAPKQDNLHGETDAESEALVQEAPVDQAEDEYQRTTVRNLSKLYWKLGMLDLQDDEAIEGYLFINFCEVYNRYIHDDFRWAKIRNATRHVLAKNMAAFSNKFEIMMPLNVGQYDQTRQEFGIDPDSKFSNMKRLDVSPNAGVPVCGSRGEQKIYPHNIVLQLLKPFTFDSLPVPPDQAEKYISSTQGAYKNMPASVAIYYYKRKAFLRLKVRMIQSQDVIPLNGQWRAVVIGEIEGFDVFSDREKKKILYTKDLRDENKAKRRSRIEAEAAAAAAAASAPGTMSETPSKIPPKPRDGSIVIDSEETVIPAKIPQKPSPGASQPQQRAPW